MPWEPELYASLIWLALIPTGSWLIVVMGIFGGIGFAEALDIPLLAITGIILGWVFGAAWAIFSIVQFISHLIAFIKAVTAT